MNTQAVQAMAGTLPDALAATLPDALAATLPDALAATLPDALAAALPAALAPLLAPVLRTSGIAYNLQCGDGLQRPFQIIPFLNGQNPTQDNALPPLHNVNDIDNLQPAQATAYLVGYGIQPIPHYLNAQKRSIRVQIGCSVGI